MTLYQNESGSKYYKEIPLSEILQVETVVAGKGGSSVVEAGGTALHCFEIRTANVDYYVGQDPVPNMLASGSPISLPALDSGIGAELAKTWEQAIRNALMPVTPHRNEQPQSKSFN